MYDVGVRHVVVVVLSVEVDVTELEHFRPVVHGAVKVTVETTVIGTVEIGTVGVVELAYGVEETKTVGLLVLRIVDEVEFK